MLHFYVPVTRLECWFLHFMSGVRSTLRALVSNGEPMGSVSEDLGTEAMLLTVQISL